jgi:hypothetical protein
MEDTFPSAEERFLKIEGPGHFLEVKFWFQIVPSKYTRELFASCQGLKEIRVAVCITLWYRDE